MEAAQFIQQYRPQPHFLGLGFGLGTSRCLDRRPGRRQRGVDQCTQQQMR
jgi:hypothetical protein